MCFEDVLIGRAARYQRYEISVPNATGSSEPLIVGNPDRYTLCLPSSDTAIYWDVIGSFSGDIGLYLPANSQPLILDIKKHGAIVTAAWSGRNTGAGALTLTVLESVLPASKLDEIYATLNKHRNFTTR